MLYPSFQSQPYQAWRRLASDIVKAELMTPGFDQFLIQNPKIFKLELENNERVKQITKVKSCSRRKFEILRNLVCRKLDE